VGDIFDAFVIEPQSEIERKLSRLICDLVGRPAISVEDNFYEQGLHSLLMIQLHNRIRSTFNIDIPIVELFAYSTIRKLANRLSLPEEGSRTLPSTPRDGTYSNVKHTPRRYARRRRTI